MRTPEMVHPSFFAFLKCEPLFQRKFWSNEFFFTKRDQNTFFDGSLERTCVASSASMMPLSNAHATLLPTSERRTHGVAAVVCLPDQAPLLRPPGEGFETGEGIADMPMSAP